jgi:hypothetical protein
VTESEGHVINVEGLTREVASAVDENETSRPPQEAFCSDNNSPLKVTDAAQEPSAADSDTVSHDNRGQVFPATAVGSGDHEQPRIPEPSTESTGLSQETATTNEADSHSDEPVTLELKHPLFGLWTGKFTMKNGITGEDPSLSSIC